MLSGTRLIRRKCSLYETPHGPVIGDVQTLAQSLAKSIHGSSKNSIPLNAPTDMDGLWLQTPSSWLL